MQFFVVYTRMGSIDGVHIGFQHNLINFLLFLGETAAHRQGTGIVGAVVHQVFGPGIHQQHIAFLQNSLMAVVVQGFAVLRQNDGERHAISIR